MKKTIPIFFAMVAMPFVEIWGQDSLLLTKNFQFADGAYYSMEELRANSPRLRFEDCVLQYFTNPQTSLTQLNKVVSTQTQQAVPLDSLWAICINGVPSIRIPASEIRRELPQFAALKLRGKICYFTYPDLRTKKVRLAAYNPMTGRPFRQGTVERQVEVFFEKMLSFQTGEVVDFNASNLADWIQDDPVLAETLLELPESEREEKLFKTLLIYVDRNPVYLR